MLTIFQSLIEQHGEFFNSVNFAANNTAITDSIDYYHADFMMTDYRLRYMHMLSEFTSFQESNFL